MRNKAYQNPRNPALLNCADTLAHLYRLTYLCGHSMQSKYEGEYKLELYYETMLHIAEQIDDLHTELLELANSSLYRLLILPPSKED